MKKFLTVVLQGAQPISKTLLLASFGAGYVVATILFTFFSSQIHRLLQSIFS
ncbi:MAG: hypothetical protein Q8918_13530 [Bacteroidota bacterium]|nr:hypothetical protein [Bacteroidota bacterium]MDP4211213.1 hypothetical protein [Bacteroidota bacterium]MDP4251121.1 hypothetical protein [Bacteroidota bacterium]